MPIIRYAEAEVDRSDPGVAARRLVSKYMGAQTFTAGISTFEPGASIFLHTHPCEEIVVILDGEAVGDVDGELSDVHTFDVSFVPPGVPHRFLAKSDTPFTMMYVYPLADVARDPVDPADAPGSGAAHR
jgi:putative monooxygenase